MEILQPIKSASTPRRGCNPMMSTQRSKMHSQRMMINKQLCKEMRLRAGAENLLNATNNAKVRETVALELSYMNSNLQLLKEELSDLNSRVEPYQNKSCKTVSIPMLPVGLKDTNDLEFSPSFEEFLSEHYGEDPRSYSEELADFTDMRSSVRTPARNNDGVSLLLEYYNQLYFIENRFFSPHNPIGVYFRWYDSITGVPIVQKSVSLEKASVLFNVGALYSQVATRADRTRRKGIDRAIDAFQRSAGAYDYLRDNFTNALNPDLSHPFLSALSHLMLAQAQECGFECKLLGGFEIELGKCASIAQEAIQVAEKYEQADRALNHKSLKTYAPYSWINMTQVKTHHYRALAHYYAALGLLEQHEAAEPKEISRLLSTLYLESKNADIPTPEEASKRHEDRRRLGKSHLREALFFHERALQTHSLCKIARPVDILKEYLQHAHERSLGKFAEIDSEEDFFELLEAPVIQAFADRSFESLAPAFGNVPSTDIFRRLGPLTIFSAHYRLGSPRNVTLTSQDEISGFSLHGDSPVTIHIIDEQIKRLGIRNDDVVIAIDDVDVKWANRKTISHLIDNHRGFPVVIKLITVLGAVTTAGVTTAPANDCINNNNNSLHINGNAYSEERPIVRMRRNGDKGKNIKKRHSFGFFQGLKFRTKQDRFSTIVENPQRVESGKSETSLKRSSTTSTSFLRPGVTIFRQKKDLSSECRSKC